MEGRKLQRKAFLRRLGGLACGVGVLAFLRGKSEKANPVSAGEASNLISLRVRRDERAVAQDA